MKSLIRTAMRFLLKAEDFVTKCINRLAIEYDGGVHVKHRLMRYHDFFVDRINSSDRVLDVGCGYGAVAYSVASRTGASVTGIDLRAENIAKAQKLFQHPNLKFLQGDVLKDLPNGSFDVIMLSNILEHIEHRIEFLIRVHERLYPKRYLIRVPMFNREWRVPLRKELGLPYFSDPTHYTEYSQESFEKEICAAGLALTHVQINWGEIWAEAQPLHS
jgi:2-polyprenyl-3-methyl-5-hydroxy-6-metoxy-1,4-benzoquinol methylase